MDDDRDIYSGDDDDDNRDTICKRLRCEDDK
jgi:hypothetical protein